MPFRFARESHDIYRVLVADLANSAVATIILGVTLIGIAVTGFEAMRSSLLLAAGTLCGAGTVGKLAMMARQNRRESLPCRHTTRIYEFGHIVTTMAVAVSVATVATILFASLEEQWHVLATALLLCYCSGVVSRLSIRPWIAIPALTIASVPVILMSASWSDLPHRVASLIFVIFLPTAFDSVRHVHARAVREIAMRLDMAALARNDPLTGLVNRLGLRETFRERINAGGEVGVLYLDLDGFKGINDRLGHASGDLLLIEVAARIREVAGTEATVARVGGDEFVILSVVKSSEADLHRLGQQIVAAIDMPFLVGGVVVTIGCSAGHATGSGATNDLDDLLKLADLALYDIKRAGGGAVRSSMGLHRGHQREARPKLTIVS